MQLPHGALEMLERGGVIVAANARAARDLRRLFGKQQQTDGRKAWASPAIFDFHGWLAAEWQRLLLTGTEQRLLLTALQEESVWAEIVLPVVRSRSLLSPGEVARLAKRAYASFVEFGGQIGFSRLEGNAHEAHGADDTLEQELFRGWSRTFMRRCDRRGWLSHSQLPWVLAHAYQKKHLSAPAAMGWIGFDRYTPAETALREALQDADCDADDLEWTLHAEQHLVCARNEDEELEACAHWAREKLALQPEARIGVLTPDVASLRAALDRTFRRVLMPASRGLRKHAARPVYEFTLGMALADIPMVRAALLLLQWMHAPLEQVEISWLITAGFFGNPAETLSLADADGRLRQKELLPPEEEMEAFLKRLGRRAPNAWLRCMRRARAAIEPLLSKERSFRQWVATVDLVLAAARWPGAQQNDDMLYQVRERWQRALEEMAALDFAEVRIPYERFLDLLKRHARTAIFSAASEDAPVSVSGIPESAGRAFDAVWILQATDEALPARSSAQAMLPAWLQKELGMPRGDAQEDYAFGTVVMERLRSSTPELMFSYAREGALGAQRPSAMITRLHEETAPVSANAGDVLLTSWFDDVVVVPWPAGALAPGGQGALKMQAACPFQGFAGKRLGGLDIRASEHGFDARQRGTLVHAVLQSIWSDDRLKDQAGLKQAIFSGQMEELVRQHVSDALAKYKQDASAWEEQYLALEEQRLGQLALDWLLYESRRQPFAVEQTELKQEIEIAGLRLGVRMDRIDKLEQGRILIDYKTGPAKWKEWMGDRPDEPQLPLYAVAGNVSELRDIYFAKLRADAKERKFLGAVFKDDCGIIPNPRKPVAYSAESDEEFQVFVSKWQQALEDLSLEFQAGIATVQPKDGAETCKYCAFSGLCRVAEVASLSPLVEDEEVC